MELVGLIAPNSYVRSLYVILYPFGPQGGGGVGGNRYMKLEAFLQEKKKIPFFSKAIPLEKIKSIFDFFSAPFPRSLING